MTTLSQNPTTLPGVTVATFPTYVEAQRAIDQLADEKFPVQHVHLLGQELTSIEDVTGRMTKGRAALAGLGTGAWVGLLLGLLLGLFLPAPVWLSILLTSVALGALWGALLGFVAHWASGGRRDFTSVQGLRAKRYDLVVEAAYADEAARVLATHDRR